MKEEQFYQISLTCIPGIGSQTIKQLLAYCGSAKAALNSSSGKLRKIPGIGEKTASLLKNTPFENEARRKFTLLEKHQVQFTFYGEEAYPSRLRHCPDAPVILFHKGKPLFNKPRIVSIVGTRNASEYGKMLVGKIVADLKKYDPVIVSGLAYGIDIAAHKAALDENLITWAIIAGGHENIYPAAHLKTCQKILEDGCVISEHVPDTIPEAMNFPERNRIIAGISDGTLVVEAKETGGALITADIANSYDREVFATPGQVGSASSEGCHALIKKNMAHLVTSGDDIARLLGWDKVAKEPVLISEERFSPEEHKILTMLKDKDLHIDDISWKSGLPIHSLAGHLLNLEMQGLIKALPGKKFKFIF